MTSEVIEGNFFKFCEKVSLFFTDFDKDLPEF